MEKQNVETIKMVDRALEVLDILRKERSPLGVNEIAKSCELNPSTAFRILKTLEVNGWVYQCNDGRYITGQKISFVIEKNNLYLALKEVAELTMIRCTEEHGQPMNLIVREGHRCYVLQQSRTKSIVNYVPALYSELPFYACAGGKVLMSELPISLVEKLVDSCDMEPLTPYTIIDRDEFWLEVRKTAKRGYAFDHRESSDNGSCISVPVRDSEGNMIAALSFSGFVGIKDTDELLPYLPVLKEASEEITRNLFQCWGR